MYNASVPSTCSDSRVFCSSYCHIASYRVFALIYACVKKAWKCFPHIIQGKYCKYLVFDNLWQTAFSLYFLLYFHVVYSRSWVSFHIVCSICTSLSVRQFLISTMGWQLNKQVCVNGVLSQAMGLIRCSSLCSVNIVMSID